MDELSIFKRIKLLRDYRILVKRNKKQIEDPNNGLNLRIDKAGRIYTVFTCPDDVKQYGMTLAEKYIKEYISKVDVLFINTGLTQYVGIREITQMLEYGELHFLIVFGFKGFDTAKFYRNLIIFGIVSILSIIGYFSFFF